MHVDVCSSLVNGEGPPWAPLHDNYMLTNSKLNNWEVFRSIPPQLGWSMRREVPFLFPIVFSACLAKFKSLLRSILVDLAWIWKHFWFDFLQCIEPLCLFYLINQIFEFFELCSFLYQFDIKKGIFVEYATYKVT